MALPMDILVCEVLQCIAKGEDGARRLCAVRCICRALNEAGNDKSVLREVNVSTSQLITINSKKSYEDFLTACARCGNHKANYILGMSYVYLLGKRGQGMRCLLNGSLRGMVEAYYLLAMLSFEKKKTRSTGARMFQTLSNPSYRIDLDAVRARIGSVLAANGYKNGHRQSLQWHCSNDMCGFHLINGPQPFGGNIVYYFCSLDCTVAYDYYKFVKAIEVHGL